MKGGQTDIPHRAFLESSFRNQIVLGIDKPQKINIYSFTNKRVAKGYRRVVTTCKGMYYEMRREQVDWAHWNNRRVTVGGDWCWRAEGVSLYNPTRENLNRTIVQHRFAINPRRDTPRKMMRKDRYYIHVYQTRIGSERRTLRSKGIARELKRRFSELYWPREMDKEDGVRRTVHTNLRLKVGDPSRMMREVKRPNGRQSNKKGRN